MILTPKLKLPRPEENDNHNLANQQALVDAIDANALPKSDKGIPLGLATLGADGKVIGSQLATPTNATTTTKGIVKLNDSTESTSVLEAATANAVRKVAEASATHLADEAVHLQAGERVKWNGKQDALPVENRRKITFGTADPTGGVDGDIYFQYE